MNMAQKAKTKDQILNDLALLKAYFDSKMPDETIGKVIENFDKLFGHLITQKRFVYLNYVRCLKENPID